MCIFPLVTGYNFFASEGLLLHLYKWFEHISTQCVCSALSALQVLTCSDTKGVWMFYSYGYIWMVPWQNQGTVSTLSSTGLGSESVQG